MTELKDNIAVITGASRGIGEAIAYKFAEEKISLALFARDKNKLREVADKCRSRNVEVMEFCGDVAEVKFVNESIASVLEKLGRIDHLVNNAGTAVFKKFLDTSLEEFKSQVDANMYGVFNFSKAVLPNMIDNNSGSIINISSLAGKNGFQNGTTYSATKHAVMGFTKSLFLEVRKYNIRVAAVCPGSVLTNLISNNEMSPKNPENILKPADVAEVVLSIIKLPVNALVSEIEIRPTNP